MRLELSGDVAGDVPVHEIARLSGYPPARELRGEALRMVEAARAWSQENARPSVFFTPLEVTALGEGTTSWSSPTATGTFTSSDLAGRLSRAGAHGLFVVCVTVGTALEAELDRLGREKDDVEAAFLDRFAAAWVEWMLQLCEDELGRRAVRAGEMLLPGRSPGREDWDLCEQPLVLAAFGAPLSGVELLSSGMLVPRHSLLTVFGRTRLTVPRAAAAAVPCADCSFAPCAFRRAAHVTTRALGASRT